MNGERSAPSRRLWLTVGEIVAVAALVIAGLNYWDARQERLAAARHLAQTSSAETAFVARASRAPDGHSLTLAPLNPSEVITSERYVFPHAITADVESVTAATPEIAADWVAPGVKRAVGAAGLRRPGVLAIPVVIETSFIEGGDAHTDASLYLLGVAWRPRLLLGPRVTLTGLSLSRRGVRGDPQKLADAAWSSRKTLSTP